MSKYYTICRNNIGKKAQISTRDGRSYTGIISRVTKESVFLNQLGQRIAGKKERSSLTEKAKTAIGTTVKPKGQQILFPGIIPLAAITGLTVIGTAPFYGGYGGFYRPFGPYYYGFGRPFVPYGYGRFRYGPPFRRGFWY